MWIKKLARGVLELDTPIGPRYLAPNFMERLLLVWTFRNFSSLPQQVLCAREQQLIDRLASENRFVSMSLIGEHDVPIIGRVERRPPSNVEVLPIRKPATSASRSVAEQGREAISA
jgi:hypothetical protein